MKIPLSWLKEHIDTDKAPAEIGRILTMIGLEVDAIETVYPSFENVVVGTVARCEKHPDADNLQVAQVTDGNELVQVVCGAPNCREGMKTAFAPVGAVLTDQEGKEFKIKKVKIRGVESYGMLCSENELGLADSHAGIMELPEDAEQGSSLKELFSEIVLDISLTPNLGHCGSVVGVARELAAMLDSEYKVPTGAPADEAEQGIEEMVGVEVEDVEKCPRYACRAIFNVKIAPSPMWLQKKLLLSDIRPINNVVDATNYVLLEMGQPLHAFDYEKIGGKKIIVRSGERGESINALDGRTHALNEEILVIADENKPIAVGGVIGGEESEVKEGTTNIILECAYFLPAAIRKGSKALGVMTDASKKFERGCDPNNILPALNRAAALVQELAGGEVLNGTIDIKSDEFGRKTIDCRLDKVNALLGTILSAGEVESVFQRLKFPFSWKGENLLEVNVPTYRVDISEEVDLIEEIARFFGYDNIPKHKPRFQVSDVDHSPIFLFEREVRQRLISEGLQEFLNCDLISPKLASLVKMQSVGEEAIVKVLNPKSVEQSILRQSLLPGLLEVIKHNQDFQLFNLSGFEVGRVHIREEEQYKEQTVAGIIMTGRRSPHHWGKKDCEVDFFDLKGAVENILGLLAIPKVDFEKSGLHPFHPGRQASVIVNEIQVGSLGEIHPSITRQLDLSQRIYYAELNLHDLLPLRELDKKMALLPQYPSSDRDWNVTLKEGIEVSKVFSAIEMAGSSLLDRVSLLDVFENEELLGKGKKKITLNFVYRDPLKTLSREEVDSEHSRLTREALKTLGKAVI